MSGRPPGPVLEVGLSSVVSLPGFNSPTLGSIALVDKYRHNSAAAVVSRGVLSSSSKYLSNAALLASIFAGACPLNNDLSGGLTVKLGDRFKAWSKFARDNKSFSSLHNSRPLDLANTASVNTGSSSGLAPNMMLALEGFSREDATLTSIDGRAFGGRSKSG